MKEEVPSNKVSHEMASEVVRCLLASGARVVTIQPDVMGGVVVVMSTKHRYTDIGCPNEGGWVSMFKIRGDRTSWIICESDEVTVEAIAADMVAFMGGGK